MAVFDKARGELISKIVYCGAPFSGKSTSFAAIHAGLGARRHSEMVSMSTAEDCTLSFEIQTVEINGRSARFVLYTVPGRVTYNATRQLVLKQADGIVFVADSDPNRQAANAEALQSLAHCLRGNECGIDELAVVFQYNKRDLPNAVPVDYLDNTLRRHVPSAMAVESCATSGANVLAALDAVSQLVLRKAHGGHAPQPASPQQPASSPASPARAEMSVAAHP